MRFKRLLCLVCAIVILASTCITSCDLNDVEDVKDVVDAVLDSDHEHSWDNWVFDYTEKDVQVVCTVCGEIIKTHPVSEGLEIEDGVLLGMGSCTDSIIVVPNGVTVIGDGAFKNNKDMTGILLPNTLTVIGSGAFKNCMSLKVINVPEGVKLIDRTAFKNCKELYGVLLPESLAYLGKECFADCPILFTLYYKGNRNGWNNIGKHEDWNSNTNLKELEHKDWGKDCEHEWSRWSIIKSYFCYTEGEVQRVCSKCNKVEREKREPMHECSNNFEEQVTVKIVDPTCFAEGREAVLCLCGEAIAAWNFKSLGHKTTVSIEGDTLTVFCKNCNKNVLVTEYVKGSEGLDIQGGRVYGIGSCTDKNIVIPPYYNGFLVTSIENGAFQNTDITSVSIPDTVVSIESHAFYGCGSLENAEMSSSLQFIGDYAFSGCSSLKSVYLYDGLYYIGDMCFSGCEALASLSVPDSLANIGTDAFFVDANRSSSVFNRWNNGIYLGNDNNPYLILVDVDSKEVTSFEIHKDTALLHNYESRNVFWNIQNLKSISISNDNPYFKTIDGVLYSKDGKVLLAYPGGKTQSEFTVPNGVTEISQAAFNHTYNLKKVNLPDTVNYIGINAFLNCGAEEINIPDGIKTIKNHAFSGSFVKSLVLPEGITLIESMAFLNCSSLGTIWLPESLSVIATEAFSGCNTLYEVHYAGTQKQWHEIAKEYDWDDNIENYTMQYGDGSSSGEHTHIFGLWSTVKKPTETENGLEERSCACGEKETKEIPSLSHVHIVEEWTVVKEATETENGLEKGVCTECGREVERAIAAAIQSLEYKLNDDKKSYSVVGIGNWISPELVIPDTYNGLPVTAIGETAFYENTLLTHVTIGNNVESIGMGAFLYSAKLESVNIPDSVESIGAVAFSMCRALKTVRMGDNVKSIGERAFYYCLALEEVNLSNNLETIDSQAFSSCIRLKEITIPDSVKSIGSYSFYCCSIERLTIGKGLESIGEEAFYGCKYVVTIIVDQQNEHFKIVDGALYSKDGAVLILSPLTTES